MSPMLVSVDPENQGKVRRLLEEEFERHSEHYHPIDVERVRTDPWQIERFLTRSNSVTETFQRIKETLQWKKTSRVHEKRDEDFAREFYELNHTEVLGRDDQGSLVVWNTSRYSSEFSNLKLLIKEFVVHEMEILDHMAGRNGILLVSDAKHVSVFTVDLEMSRFTNDLVTRHYPGAVRLSLVFNLSAVLDPIMKIVLNFMDEELRRSVVIVNQKNITQYLDKAFIPIEYGGTRQNKCPRVPPKAPSYADLGISLTQKQAKRYREFLNRSP